MSEKPAILGGKPVFEKMVPIIRPSIDRYVGDPFLKEITEILKSNMVSGVNNYVRKLEKAVSEYIGVKNALSLSSCTSGLMLSIQALGLRDKEVLVPSFTFSATAHSAYWNNCKIKFVDCDPETFNISIDDMQEKMTDKTAGILPVHLFGNPCDVKALREITEDRDLKIIYDSAHALGSVYDGKKVGQFGDVEIFSASPTKLISTMEGGILTTNNDELAKTIEVTRNYGNNPDYTCKIPGLSARMPEINAALGLYMLKDIDTFVKNRNEHARRYKQKLSGINGLKYQEISENSVSAYKDFAIVIDEDKFGLSRDTLCDALSKENVMTKKYFYPPIHMLEAYRSFATGELPNTEYLARNIVCLPMHNFMDADLIDKICLAIKRIYENAEEAKSWLAR
jgi:dTDP-4-amino-4,6-dideoxygalactose transaminase